MTTEHAHAETSRVDTMQQKFLNEGNLGLTPPLVFSVYGDNYRIARKNPEP